MKNDRVYERSPKFYSILLNASRPNVLAGSALMAIALRREALEEGDILRIGSMPGRMWTILLERSLCCRHE